MLLHWGAILLGNVLRTFRTGLTLLLHWGAILLGNALRTFRTGLALLLHWGAILLGNALRTFRTGLALRLQWTRSIRCTTRCLHGGRNGFQSVHLLRQRSRGLFWHGGWGLLWCRKRGWRRLALRLHWDILLGPLLRHAFRNGLTKCPHMCRLRRNLYCS